LNFGCALASAAEMKILSGLYPATIEAKLRRVEKAKAEHQNPSQE
jgi:hypothetical protein